ncbi:unnamed protein product [Microthlaspi erraticum]|uniref:BHLH domain-containing protein n=1 Tax=Microthlaspi erraticum TaxID=1685480 RepID=A0A6D2JU72_9BRAS|nr:unnamed protein product [Microthlaspi erraticum]
MDADFFLNDLSLEDIDFDFNLYEENSSSTFEQQICEEKPKPAVEPMMKINNKPRVISFDFSRDVSSFSAAEEINMDRLVGRGTKRKSYSPARRSSLLAKEHVLAERKRREKLSEKFIALSALLPGLKKADKVTVLDDAISRMKQLQQEIVKLEEEKNATRELESMILVKKSKVLVDDKTLDEERYDQALPEIEVKVSKKDVLIRIHCEKSKGCMINILNTIEDLQLRIENTVILPFGDSTLDVTVLAQMEKEFSVNVVKDLVRNLRLTIL